MLLALLRRTPARRVHCRHSSSVGSTSSPLLPLTIKQLIACKSSILGEPVTVNGWVQSVRKQKNVAFAAITDGSSMLQAVLDPKLLSAKDLTNGCTVELKGSIQPSPGRGQTVEMHVSEVIIHGECDAAEYPIQKQQMTEEHLRDNLHLRARTQSIVDMMWLRDRQTRAIHSFFEAEGFCQIHTPILTSNDCEGAGEAFRIADLSPPDSASSTSNSSPLSDRGFFSRPAYLTVSAQLHLEAFSAGLNRVYTINPCFRAERSATNRHLAEFWMVEAEWSFVRNVNEICDVVETIIKRSLAVELRRGTDRPELLQAADTCKPWSRITYSEAIQILKEAPITFEYDPKWGKPLQSEHERYLADKHTRGPVFVTNYPATLKPFYMRKNEVDDGYGPTVACFDLLIPGVGELVGGSLREERLPLLRQSLKSHNIHEKDMEWYMDLRKYGSTPHGGFGMGFERYIAWVGGVGNIRESIPFPRWTGRLLL